jgi:hypothetical protein
MIYQKPKAMAGIRGARDAKLAVNYYGHGDRDYAFYAFYAGVVTNKDKAAGLQTLRNDEKFIEKHMR